EPGRASTPWRNIGWPVEVHLARCYAIAAALAAQGAGKPRQFCRCYAAVLQGNKQSADLDRISFPLKDDRHGVIGLRHGQGARPTRARTGGYDVFGEPLRWVVGSRHLVQPPADRFRRRHSFRQYMTSRGKRLRGCGGWLRRRDQRWRREA